MFFFFKTKLKSRLIIKNPVFSEGRKLGILFRVLEKTAGERRKDKEKANLIQGFRERECERDGELLFGYAGRKASRGWGPTEVHSGRHQ